MIRCSSISKIMTKPKSNAEEWSQTAKEEMLNQARTELFGVRKDIGDIRCIQKGKMCEEEGIALYNDVFMFNLKKVESSGRRDNGIITGEPDIVAKASNKGIDIKIAWSLLTFPLTSEQAAKKEYEWQARGYMCLFNVDEWEIAYCAVDTPEELIKPWDDPAPHIIDDAIPIHHRITIKKYERDVEIESVMLEKCARANQYVQDAVKVFAREHDQYIA